MSRLEFEPGLTLLRVPSARSTVVHRLVCATLTETDATGDGYWIDARNVASTHALYDCAPSPRSLRSLRIARAFTAYQHHSLVRQVAREATPGTALIVAPNVAAPYRHDDLPAWEREELLASTLVTLRELGRVLETPVLATSVGDDGPTAVAEYADREVECVRTREGIRFEGDTGPAMEGYWHGSYWQTTIPYWVALCGVAEAVDPHPVDPVVAAHDQGLLAPGLDGFAPGRDSTPGRDSGPEAGPVREAEVSG